MDIADEIIGDPFWYNPRSNASNPTMEEADNELVNDPYDDSSPKENVLCV